MTVEGILLDYKVSLISYSLYPGLLQEQYTVIPGLVTLPCSVLNAPTTRSSAWSVLWPFTPVAIDYGRTIINTFTMDTPLKWEYIDNWYQWKKTLLTVIFTQADKRDQPHQTFYISRLYYLTTPRAAQPNYYKDLRRHSYMSVTTSCAVSWRWKNIGTCVTASCTVQRWTNRLWMKNKSIIKKSIENEV